MNTPDTEEKFDFKAIKEYWGLHIGPKSSQHMQEKVLHKIYLKLISSHTTYWKERVRKEVEKMKKKSVCRNPAHGKESHTCENTVRNKVLTDIVEFIIRDKTNGL